MYNATNYSNTLFQMSQDAPSTKIYDEFNRCQMRSAMVDCPSDFLTDPVPMYKISLDTILARAKLRQPNNIQLRPQRAKLTNLRVGIDPL